MDHPAALDSDAMTGLRLTRPVPVNRAHRYRAEGWWDTCGLADGIEAAAAAAP